MKFFRLLLLLVGGLLILNSCTIYNKVHFNRDYSGTYEMKFDLESLMMMASMMDTTGTMSEEELLDQVKSEMNEDEIISEINAMDGVSNAEVIVSKEEGFVVRFDFDNIPSLNNSFAELQSQMNNMGEMEGETAPEVERYDAFQLEGKKTLVFRSPPQEGGNPLFGNGNEGEEGEEMFGDVSEFLEMKIDFSFDRKIKSVEAKSIEILAQETHRVFGDVKMQEVVDGNGYELKVKLK